MLPRAPTGWLLGIDASRFQGRLNVPALRAAGVEFISAKAADGEHDEDQQWAPTAAAAAAAKMPLSPYGVIENYGRARADGQARHFVDVVKGAHFTLPPVLDFELPVHPDQVSPGQAVEIIASARAWCDLVEDALGMRVIVYTGIGFIAPLARLAGTVGAVDLHALATRDLWVADYGSGKHLLLPDEYSPRIPAPWTRATWWQSGPFGATLPWGTTPIDVDWFHGSAEDLAALGRGGSAKQARRLTP